VYVTSDIHAPQYNYHVRIKGGRQNLFASKEASENGGEKDKSAKRRKTTTKKVRYVYSNIAGRIDIQLWRLSLARNFNPKHNTPQHIVIIIKVLFCRLISSAISQYATCTLNYYFIISSSCSPSPCQLAVFSFLS
jgi:hypothetical protein